MDKKPYYIELTEKDIDTISFVGFRYCWSDCLDGIALFSGKNELTEAEAWTIKEAMDKDTEGNHSLFPMLTRLRLSMLNCYAFMNQLYDIIYFDVLSCFCRCRCFLRLASHYIHSFTYQKGEVMKKNDETTRIVKAIKKTIPKNCTLPILENVLLTGENCIATDLNISVSIPFRSIPCVFPARDFCDVLTEHGRAFQIATNKERKIFVTAGNEKLTVAGEDAECFPVVNMIKGETVGTLSDADFQSLQTAAHFIDNEKNGRISMQHILWHQHCVGTCGKRLYWKKSDCVPFFPFSFCRKHSNCLPFSAFLGMYRLSGKTRQSRQAKFKNLFLLTATAFSSLKLFALKCSRDTIKSSLPITKNGLQSTKGIDCRRVKTKVCPGNNKQVRFSLNEKSIVSAEDIDFGREFSVKISGKYEGEPLEIGFNADILTSILKQSPAETTTILIDKANRGVIIDNNFLLMPGKIKLVTHSRIILAGYPGLFFFLPRKSAQKTHTKSAEPTR